MTQAELSKLTPAQQAHHYIELAEQWMEKHNCRWQEACRQIKKRHSGAHEAFAALGADQRAVEQ
jgi:hypothetical protein